MTDTDDHTLMAKLAYVAYGRTTGFKNFQGNPMPAFNDLGDTIQAAWKAAALAVRNHCTGQSPLNESGYILNDHLAVDDHAPSS